ncbi:conserved hypothetical protein [Streptomyces sp. SPB78]|nr:conserved hypothetical protein [Streptomyces sp. SPB78]
MRHPQAVAGKYGGERGGDMVVVLHEQQSHRPSPPSAGVARPPPGPGVLVRTRSAPRTVPAGARAGGQYGRERAGRFGMYSDSPGVRQEGSGFGRVLLSSRYEAAAEQARDVRG